MKSKNKTGFTGVHYTANGKRFTAQISVNNREVYLGTFDTPEQASKAYQDAVEKYRNAEKKI
jgi:AP2 domain